jgi:hypothetical protein
MNMDSRDAAVDEGLQLGSRNDVFQTLLSLANFPDSQAFTLMDYPAQLGNTGRKISNLA